MRREHYLYCAIAKHCFLHKTHGLVFSNPAISCAAAKKYGLRPLLMYGVSVAGTTLKRITLCAPDTPLSFSYVLAEAWASAPALKGKPDCVRVNRYIAFACPQLKSLLATIGVELSVCDARDKQTPAALRSGQQGVLELGWRNYCAPVIKTIEDFNAGALSCLANDVFLKHWRTSSKERAANHEAWLDLPTVALDVHLPDSGVWEKGAWLSSWETNLPPDPLMTLETTREGRVWLYRKHDDDIMDEADDVVEDDDDVLSEWGTQGDNFPITAKIIADCWPNNLSEIGKSVGATQKELQWFFSGQADLSSNVRYRLAYLLWIEPDDDGIYQAVMPRVLIADRLRKAIAAYDEVSHGGDLQLSFEAVPESSNADPSWRYLVMCSWGGSPSILMFPRGGSAVEKLDSTHFMNFDGIKATPNDFYRDLVQTCAAACRSPSENVAVTTTFFQGQDLEAYESDNW